MGLGDYYNKAVKYVGDNVNPQSIVDGANGAINFLDPARPYNQQAVGLDQGAKDAKALAALQWQREMAGLAQALGYQQKTQNVINAVYAPKGPSLPAGMLPTPATPAQGEGGLAAYMKSRMGGMR